MKTLRVALFTLMAAILAGCDAGGGSGGAAALPPPRPPPPPQVSSFQTWCAEAVGDVYEIRDGVTARILDAQFTAAIIGQSFEICRQSGELGRPGTTRVAEFEVVAPSHWRGRLLFRGGGGFDGVISPFTYSPEVLEHRFATVATDMGHQAVEGSNDQSWALNDPDAVDDYAFAAIPDVRQAAVSVLCSYFVYTGDGGADCELERVYFEGCSNGGRSALLAAQRAPDLFDGVIARAPVLQWPGLAEAAHRLEKRIDAQPLTNEKLATVDAAQLAACDALDGIADGVMSRFIDCPFDAESLRCTEGDGPDCLTDAELETLATVRSPTSLSFGQRDGLTEHPAFPISPIGHLLTWPLWLQPSAQFPVPALFATQEAFFRYFVTMDPTLDPLRIDPADYATELAALSSQLDATSTNLAAFAARGGKLILWHGAIDAGISPLGTIEYYEALQAAAAADPTLPAVEDYVRLYIAPGVAHCARGPGADEVDLVSVLDAWVDGTPPGAITAHSKYTSSGDRPLCEWPGYPHYHGLGDHGAGDPTFAGNYACQVP
jgi:feruloyl esterase